MKHQPAPDPDGEADRASITPTDDSTAPDAVEWFDEYGLRWTSSDGGIVWFSDDGQGWNAVTEQAVPVPPPVAAPVSGLGSGPVSGLGPGPDSGLGPGGRDQTEQHAAFVAGDRETSPGTSRGTTAATTPSQAHTSTAADSTTAAAPTEPSESNLVAGLRPLLAGWSVVAVVAAVLAVMWAASEATGNAAMLAVGCCAIAAASWWLLSIWRPMADRPTELQTRSDNLHATGH